MEESKQQEGEALAYALFGLRKLVRHWATIGRPMLVTSPLFVSPHPSQWRGLDGDTWTLTEIGHRFFYGRPASGDYSPKRLTESAEIALANKHRAIVESFLKGEST